MPTSARWVPLLPINPCGDFNAILINDLMVTCADVIIGVSVISIKALSGEANMN